MIISQEIRPFVYSLGVHCFIGLLFVIHPYFSSESKPFQSAIRIDVVAMPKKYQKIIKKKEKIVETLKKEKVKAVEKTISRGYIKKKQGLLKKENFEENAFAKLVRMQEEKNKKVRKQKDIVGNRVSKGVDLKGIEKIEYSNYRVTLHRAISAQWDVPKWLLEGNLSAIVHIKIDENGNLIFQKVIKSSGNSIYDEKVRGAIKDAAPFSPPPEKFKKIVYYEGVELLFPR